MILLSQYLDYHYMFVCAITAGVLVSIIFATVYIIKFSKDTKNIHNTRERLEKERSNLCKEYNKIDKEYKEIFGDEEIS